MVYNDASLAFADLSTAALFVHDAEVAEGTLGTLREEAVQAPTDTPVLVSVNRGLRVESKNRPTPFCCFCC